MKRYVFMISDGTGITAEALGSSLLTQFETIQFEKQTIPYVDSEEKAMQTFDKINRCYEETGTFPLVFLTVVNPALSAIILKAKAKIFDLFHTFLGPMEKELLVKSSYTVGRTHGVANNKKYNYRIDAIEYALSHDDGIKAKGYDKADIILIGVSRSGKTPSCLYMALQFGILAANYPFTEDDMKDFHLPEVLRPYKNKLFGLTIDVERLVHIRNERRPNSQYASMEQCRKELKEVESMFIHENIPYLNSTRFSIEEISTKILAESGLKRKI